MASATESLRYGVSTDEQCVFRHPICSKLSQSSSRRTLRPPWVSLAVVRAVLSFYRYCDSQVYKDSKTSITPIINGKHRDQWFVNSSSKPMSLTTVYLKTYLQSLNTVKCFAKQLHKYLFNHWFICNFHSDCHFECRQLFQNFVSSVRNGRNDEKLSICLQLIHKPFETFGIFNVRSVRTNDTKIPFPENCSSTDTSVETLRQTSREMRKTRERLKLVWFGSYCVKRVTHFTRIRRHFDLLDSNGFLSSANCHQRNNWCETNRTLHWIASKN